MQGSEWWVWRGQSAKKSPAVAQTRSNRDARFPAETVAEFRKSGLLGAMVADDARRAAARRSPTCPARSSQSPNTARRVVSSSRCTIYRSRVWRATEQPRAIDEVLARVATGSLLLANANSEVGLGGETTHEPLRTGAEGRRLPAREAGVHRFVRRVRGRDPGDGAARSRQLAHDQVLAVCLKPNMQVEPTGDWDTLGLRGTCSRPCHLTADVPADLVVPDYADVFARTSLPVSGVLLSSVWMGIAESAARRAHTSVRGQARKNRGAPSESAVTTGPLRLAELGLPLTSTPRGARGGRRRLRAL